MAVVVVCIFLAACGADSNDSDNSSGGEQDSGGDSGGDSGADSGDDSGTVSFSFTPGNQARITTTDPLIVIESTVELDGDSITNGAVHLEGPNGIIATSAEYADQVITMTPEGPLSPDSDFIIRITDDVVTASGESIDSEVYSSFRTVSLAAQPPALGKWEADMVEYGHQWGQALQSESDYLTGLSMVYYDAERVFYQIADYIGEAEPWESYAAAARGFYGQYLTSNDFGTSGYWRFPHGLFRNWKRNASSVARNHLIQLRDNAAFSYPATDAYADSWYEQRYSREIAYGLHNQMLAERAGESRQTARVDAYVDMALTHIEIWTTGNFISTDPSWQFVQAFMTGLTASALIEYYERSVALGSPDERVPQALETLADWLWANMWIADVDGNGHGAFSYVTPAVSGVGGEGPAPDLSLLIAPMYAWLYRHTGDARHLERGDAVFEGGVVMDSLHASNKHFNQAYRASFDFVEWRAEGYALHGD